MKRNLPIYCAITFVTAVAVAAIVTADDSRNAKWTVANACVQENGESREVRGVKVEAIPSYNSRHTKGRGNAYIVTIGGKRIYISGDTGDVAEMRAMENIDVAFLCMNVPFTMTVSEAASAVRDFKPAVVYPYPYPYHFRNQDNSLSDLVEFTQLVGADDGVEVRRRNWY